MSESTKRMYILLTRSKTILSIFIRSFTKSEYTHASLGFSEDCMQLYSFARKYKNLPFPGAFMLEKIDRGYFGNHPKIPCALYYIDVPEKAFDSAYEEVVKMYNKKKQYRYNYMGLFSCWFGKEKDRKNRYFCSEFVAHTLKNAGVLSIDKHPSLVRPVDFKKMSDLNLVYEGNIGGLKNKILVTVG